MGRGLVCDGQRVNMEMQVAVVENSAQHRGSRCYPSRGQVRCLAAVCAEVTCWRGGMQQVSAQRRRVEQTKDCCRPVLLFCRPQQLLSMCTRLLPDIVTITAFPANKSKSQALLLSFEAEKQVK